MNISQSALRAGQRISDRFRKALPRLPKSNAQTLAEIIDAEMQQERLEQFTRGRNWEIAEYKRHLREHTPQIGGLCSWCKLEVESGRTWQPFGPDWVRQKVEENERGFGRKS